MAEREDMLMFESDDETNPANGKKTTGGEAADNKYAKANRL